MTNEFWVAKLMQKSTAHGIEDELTLAAYCQTLVAIQIMPMFTINDQNIG
jgi:hypothetical protein